MTDVPAPRPRGPIWLSVAVLLLGLSLYSTVWVFFAGFFFDPDDYPGSHYAAEIPKLLIALTVSVSVPLLSAAASIVSILSKPQREGRVVASCVVLLLAAAVVWVCWWLGTESIETALRFARTFPG